MFDDYLLPLYPKGDRRFKKPAGYTLGDNQQCLVDNLFCSLHDKNSLIISLNVLCVYFLKIKEKPLSKNFSFYVVFKGYNPVIYLMWIKVLEQIRGFKNPVFRGYYSLEVALGDSKYSLKTKTKKKKLSFHP